jgi:hypothetical protein
MRIKINIIEVRSLALRVCASLSHIHRAVSDLKKEYRGKEACCAMKTTFTLGALLATTAWAFQDRPLMCISNPALQLVAGASTISAM